MRPSTIPDAEVWEGARRVVVSGPDGDLTGDIRPVEVLIDRAADGDTRICSRVVLDPGDLERLAAGESFWLVFRADHLHPFDVTMAEEV